MRISKLLSIATLLLCVVGCKKTEPEGGLHEDPFAQEQGSIIVTPTPHLRAFKNPLKGFTMPFTQTPNPLQNLVHNYIRWNEIETKESDGVEVIQAYCNSRWEKYRALNTKVIPRIHLHWDQDNQMFWPSDMNAGDYTSAQFKQRVVKLIEKLGLCWDNDPRVAFIEMGIFGKWGEQHSPSPTPELQKIVGDAFTRAFKNKKVTVRHLWNEFTDYQFGEYWDSWAHYDQMWGHGKSIKEINDKSQRYKSTMIGGEVAYNWGNWEIQPGDTPDHSVMNKEHRDFIINSIRWLHCTQLRWISSYNPNDLQACLAAEPIHVALGYRFVLNRVKFGLSDNNLKITLSVTNVGSAPFYYRWPIEVTLLNATTFEQVWKGRFSDDIRKWMPGENWTEPEWTRTSNFQTYLIEKNWTKKGDWSYQIPAPENIVKDEFKLLVSKAKYILSISIIDPASGKPSVKFATSNYLKGAKHPIGIVDTSTGECSPLPNDFKFDAPNQDDTLYY